MGSSSSTLRHSGWVDEQLCGCFEQHYRAFHISWKEHPMVGGAAEFGINTGRVVAGIATLGISTVFNGGIKAPLHDAVCVSFVCDRCGKSFSRTYEFGPGGKRDKWGRYEYYRNERDHRSVKVPIRVMNEIFGDMPGWGYSAVDYNCSHWAYEFFYKVCNASH
ncbi:hypothetical protein GPALN_010134 [Globodera pallida]|nr:hypothetical protein GPALN_010134 [Globodera pallida]